MLRIIRVAITTHTHLMAFLVRLSNKKLMPNILPEILDSESL